MLQSDRYDPELKQLIDQYFADFETEPEVLELKPAERMLEAIFASPLTQPVRTPTATIRLWKRIAVAAAVAAITLGVWLYYANEIASSRSTSRNDEIVQNDISPGRNTASLTLANGNVIMLDTNRASVIVTDSVKALTMLTASTPLGGTYQVVLPDGTKAWLNAASSIKFPSSFSRLKQRRVEITGEVYLEVAKDKKHPFIVESEGQQVEVLGTHFNINAYGDEGSIKTTLLEGSVRVNGMATLIPGQQSTLTGSTLKIKSVDTLTAVAWKNNEFMFESEPIQNIMKMVARWYNVEVVYQGEIPEYKFNGVVSRFDHVSKVLQVLEASKKVHFKIEGRRITVYK